MTTADLFLPASLLTRCPDVLAFSRLVAGLAAAVGTTLEFLAADFPAPRFR